jgi:hypothetical protein
VDLRKWQSVLIAGALAVPVWTVGGQVIVLPPGNGMPAGRGFSGFSAAPISPTTVLQSHLDASDSGAVLGFIVAIRGPVGWYNTHTEFGELPADSLPAHTAGQWWRVGARRYRFIYDPAQMTLTAFDTIVDLRRSRVVLVTLATDPASAAIVESGSPISFAMAQPAPVPALFLPLAPEVRTFAGLSK